MSAVDRFLARLHRVQQVGADSWIASCPTAAHPHGDRSRGLGIRSAGDRVLIKCHGGCSADNIVDAMALTLADLFEKPLGHHFPPSAGRLHMPRRELAELSEVMDHESLIVGAIGLRMQHLREIRPEDWDRLAMAVRRLGRARDHLSPAKLPPRIEPVKGRASG